MDLKMNYNSFIKLKDFFKVLNISAEIDEYNVKNDTLEGVLHIKGKYLRRDNVSEEYFLEKIPFSIVINDQDFEVEDINCIDFEYIGVEGRGVDVSFDILVKYLDNQNDNILILTNEDKIDLKILNKIKNKNIEKIDVSNINLTSFIKEEFKDYKISFKEINMLKDYTSNDYNRIKEEIIKLKMYKLDTKEINEDDIKKIMNTIDKIIY